MLFIRHEVTVFLTVTLWPHMSLPRYTHTQTHTHVRKSSRIGRRKEKTKMQIQGIYPENTFFFGNMFLWLKLLLLKANEPKQYVIQELRPQMSRAGIQFKRSNALHFEKWRSKLRITYEIIPEPVLWCFFVEMRGVVIWASTSPSTHSLTHSHTLVQYKSMAWGLGLPFKAFILTCVSALCPTKMCSASPVFPLFKKEVRLNSVVLEVLHINTLDRLNDW